MKDMINSSLLKNLFTVAILISHGCSCSDTNLGGDTATDGLNGGRWDPHIENLGETGWRDSAEPWCPGIIVGDAWDVWSYVGGVFAVIADRTGGENEDHLFFNNGTGWDLLLSGPSTSGGWETCFKQITGTPEGVLFAWNAWESGCSLLRIEDGVVEPEAFNVYNLFVVDNTLAYACANHGLMQFDGAEWSRMAIDTCRGRAMWGSERRAYLAKESGIIEVFNGEGWESWDSGTISTLTSIWGFSDDDLWVGTEDGQLRHWNGTDWQSVEWPDMDDSTDPDSCRYRGHGIEGMWGIDGTLFFHKSKQLAMWDGADFTILGYWPGEYYPTEGGFGCAGAMQVHKIWGNSPSELFIAALDGDHEITDCGPEYLLWWDGHEFHWF